MLKIVHLVSGGIITNYKCSSKCRHCSYSSSPKWPDEYMTPSMADEIFSVLKRLGCYSVHIGGGEPLLKHDKILAVLEAAQRNNIGIEYIETNSSWYKDETSVMAVLKELKKHGVKRLKVVYSKEKPKKTNMKMPDNPGKNIPGSISFVPPVAGFILASVVVNDLINNEVK